VVQATTFLMVTPRVFTIIISKLFIFTYESFKMSLLVPRFWRWLLHFLIVVQPCVIAPWWYLTVNPLCVFQLGTYSLRNKNAKFHSLLGNLSPWVWNTLYTCAQGTSCFPFSTQACITNMSASEFLIFLHKNNTRGVLWVRVLIRKQSSSIDPLTCLSSDVKNDCPLAPWQRPTRTCGQSCSKCLTHQPFLHLFH
jgi:hypothetical protein